MGLFTQYVYMQQVCCNNGIQYQYLKQVIFTCLYIIQVQGCSIHMCISILSRVMIKYMYLSTFYSIYVFVHVGNSYMCINDFSSIHRYVVYMLIKLCSISIYYSPDDFIFSCHNVNFKWGM